ncbi:MAG: hypothetical protein QXP58_04330 [Thermoprotei archaeon]
MVILFSGVLVGSGLNYMLHAAQALFAEPQYHEYTLCVQRLRNSGWIALFTIEPKL